MKNNAYHAYDIVLAAFLIAGEVSHLADVQALDTGRKLFNSTHDRPGVYTLARLLAGLAADGDLSDALTWRLVRVLDASHRRAARRLRNITHGSPIKPTAAKAMPHPAINEFLRRLRSGGL